MMGVGLSMFNEKVSTEDAGGEKIEPNILVIEVINICALST